MIKTVLTTISAGVVVAALAAGCGGAAAVESAPLDRPTVVLVHGAFADSSSRNAVIKNLEADGSAPLSTRCRFRSHAVTVSQPDAVAYLIGQAANATIKVTNPPAAQRPSQLQKSPVCQIREVLE